MNETYAVFLMGIALIVGTFAIFAFFPIDAPITVTPSTTVQPSPIAMPIVTASVQPTPIPTIEPSIDPSATPSPIPSLTPTPVIKSCLDWLCEHRLVYCRSAVTSCGFYGTPSPSCDCAFRNSTYADMMQKWSRISAAGMQPCIYPLSRLYCQ